MPNLFNKLKNNDYILPDSLDSKDILEGKQGNKVKSDVSFSNIVKAASEKAEEKSSKVDSREVMFDHFRQSM